MRAKSLYVACKRENVRCVCYVSNPLRRPVSEPFPTSRGNIWFCATNDLYCSTGTANSANWSEVNAECDPRLSSVGPSYKPATESMINLNLFAYTEDFFGSSISFNACTVNSHQKYLRIQDEPHFSYEYLSIKDLEVFL